MNDETRPGAPPRARRVTYIETARRIASTRRNYVSHAAVFVLGLIAVAAAFGRIGDAPGSSLTADLWYVVPPENAVPGVGDQGGGAVLPDESAGDEGAPAAVAAPTPASASAESSADLQVAFVTHVVEPGDTLNGIAAAYGVDPQYLLWNNPEVGSDPDSLIIGQTLLVPAVDGLVYDVRLGDTINDIAAFYGIDPQAVVSFAPNGLESPDMIVEGMTLVLPGAVPPAPAEQPADAVSDAPAVVADPEPARDVAAAAGSVAPPAAPVTAYVPSVGFIWPVNGPLWSGFGPRWGSFHKGVDIGAGYGTPIVAAASGQVVLSTYSDNGYGNYVIIRHDDGSETLYAHMTERWVGLGQYVNQGDAIGSVGCTGWCSGAHLHFEVHVGGAPVDPLGYLP